ncbi:MAG TPA: dienelactone hydrolase family protein [Anaerolineales bacterium]|nr:dienelactone hydrolase family protein [Anaerolineales bacterium]
MNGQEVTFDVGGRPASGYLALPEQPNAPGIIVLHAWWGLNPFFKRMCDRLAAEGFAVFAPDLNEGRVATSVDEAKQIMDELGFERKHAVVAAAPGLLRSRPEVKQVPFSLIGFSMGGAWSLVLASEQPEAIEKMVLFYGIGEANFGMIKAQVLGHFSDADEWEPMEGVRWMEEEMRNAGIQPEFHIYPQNAHWFFEDDRPEFDPESAELAWRRTLEFLRK